MRGFGWSGWPDDGDFRKQRVADDALALLDVLGLERVRLVGHDWGGWAAILAALTAPERFSSLLALAIGHPWVPRALAARNAYRLAYMLPLVRRTRRGGLPRTILKTRAPRRRRLDGTASSTPTSRRCRRSATRAAVPHVPHTRAHAAAHGPPRRCPRG